MSIFKSISTTILLVVVFTAHVHADEQSVTRRFQSSNTDGLSSAVLVENAVLAHSTQLLPDVSVGAGHDDQVQSVLRQLEAMLKPLNAQRTDLVKLNVYLSENLPLATFMQSLREWMPTESAPAITFVNTTVPNPEAEVALDAVFIASSDVPPSSPKHFCLESLGSDPRTSDVSVLPKGDVLYVSGQAEQGDLPTATRDTLAGLLRTLEHLGLTRDHIVSLKCFLQPMSEVDVVNEQIAEFFGEAMIPPISHVEWISSEKQPIEIELIAWAPRSESEDTVSYYWLPWLSKSPVYCRATRIHGDRRLYISGLYAEKQGDGEQQVRSIFSQLEGILAESGSDLRHLAKATYYVSDADPSAQLNKLRPEYYDPKRPPAASKAMVTGVGRSGRGIAIDMIAAPSE